MVKEGGEVEAEHQWRGFVIPKPPLDSFVPCLRHLFRACDHTDLRLDKSLQGELPSTRGIRVAD
jgi:hypothetical protein